MHAFIHIFYFILTNDYITYKNEIIFDIISSNYKVIVVPLPYVYDCYSALHTHHSTHNYMIVLEFGNLSTTCELLSAE